MKVLYVSDLDGTLLNMEQELDVNTCKQINELIEKGVNFTVSTGRGDSVRCILKDVHFKYPLMLLNGALNYNWSEKKYVDKLPIVKSTAEKIIKSLENFNYKRFQIQTIINEHLERFDVSNWDTKSECISLNVLFPTEKSTKLAHILSSIDNISFFIHKKVYSPGDSFCDIVLKDISKASRLKIFKEQYGFDKVIAFGDSENDLPMVNVADEFYAVGNATEIVKQNATGVIGNCYDNGVVNFILEREAI